MAAIEAAVATYHAKQHRKTLDDAEKAAWQGVKVDIQILAIAKVSRADVIYTTDRGVVTQAEMMEIPAIHLADLPLPPENPQQEITFKADESENEPDSQTSEVRRGGDGPSEGTAAAQGGTEVEEDESGEEEAPN